MNKPLPEIISGRSHSPRAQVLAPFSTSPKPFHESESYSADATASITVDSSTEPSLPIPIPVPATKAAQSMATSSAAPEPAAAAAEEEHAGEGNLATPPIRTGMPSLPLPRPESSLSPLADATGTSTKTAPSCASMSGTSSSSSSAIEGGAFSAMTGAEIYSSSPPAASIPGSAETHMSWSSSPKRAATRHPLKPIHTSSSSFPTAAAAAAAATAAAAAAAEASGGSCNPHALSLALPSGFSHKFRRRLLDAPEVEDKCSAAAGTTASHSSDHKLHRRGSDVAAAAAAAIAATVTVSSGVGIGPADDVVKRPGLLRRCISLMEESPSSSRYPSPPTENDQGVGVESGEPAVTAGMSIPRSTSWEPFSGTSFEPPRGVVHHRRPSIPSPKNKSLSSLSGKCELGSSSSSKGVKPPPGMPAPTPANLGLTFASPTRSSSFCGSDGGLRISPLQRSDSVCSVSDADPEEEAHAASFFLSGSLSLGSDGAPRPPSPLHSCSPPVAATINDVAHAGGKSNQGGVARGGRRTRGVGVRSAKPSPRHGRGRSVGSLPSSPERQTDSESASVALSNADTPKLNRQNSCFERKTKAGIHESAPSRRKHSGQRQEDDRESLDHRATQKSEKPGCRRRAPIFGAIEGPTPSKARLPAGAGGAAGQGGAGGRTGIVDRRSSRKHHLLAADSEHESYPQDRHNNTEQPQHLLSPVPSNAKRTVDQPTTPTNTGGCSISEQTTPKLGTCAHRLLVERHEACRHNHGGDGRGGNQTLGAASSGGGGGGNLLASSSQGAGGTAVANPTQGSSLLVRRNDSILKSLLTGGNLDPAVGFPNDLGSNGEASYEFGLWKKKAKGRDEVPPISTAAVTTRSGGQAQGEAGLPPPPAKGMPTRTGVLDPFPQDMSNAAGAGVAGGRARQFRARTALELITTTPGSEQLHGSQVGAGGAARRPSPSPANRTLAKLPTRHSSGGKAAETAGTSSDVGESGEPKPTNMQHPSTAEDVLRRAADVARSSGDLKASDGHTSHPSLSNSRSNSRTSLWPMTRGSPPEFSPSPSPPPSPFPSPRQSPRLSPRAARAGTRPCKEVPLSAMADQPGGGLRTAGKDPGRLRGLKASPPLNATSRFPLTSFVPRLGGGEGSNQERGRRASNTSRRGSASRSSSSAGSGGGVGGCADGTGPRASSQQGGCCCPASASGGDSRNAHPTRHDEARRRASPSPEVDVGTAPVSGLASSRDLAETTLHQVLSPEPEAGPMAGRHPAMDEPRDPRVESPEEQVPSDGAHPAAAAPDCPPSSISTQPLLGGGQGIDTPTHTNPPNSREDRSESLTVEVSADYSSELSQDSDSDSDSGSGRGFCGRGRSVYGDDSEQAADDDEGCRTCVSRHPRRHAIHWKRGEQIGMGSFGKVFKGLNESTGELFAVKQISLTRGLKVEINTLETEIDLMKDLDHRHIVRYCGTDRGIRHLYIFLEYVPGGSIASMLQQFGVFREDLVRRFMHQILLGTRYLHDKGIIHRDIKGANVLVTEQGIAKLADFGCSKQFQGVRTPSFDDSLRTMRGSIPWMAPEMVKQTGHGRSADVWSVGATMIEMYTARYPWPPFSNNMAAMYHVATATEPPKFPKNISAEANEFLSKCLIIDPDARLKASELLQHPFLLVAEAALEASAGQGPGGFGGFGASDGGMEERTSDVL